MKIKMYTKATCFPFEGVSYEKIMCIAYDSIDDINIVNEEDASKINITEDAEVSCLFEDADSDVFLGKPVIYPHDLWNRRRSLRI